MPLSTIARLESGHTPSRRVPDYWDGDIPWIGIRDATENHGRTIARTVQSVTQAGIDNSSARILPAGTVCLSRTASVGYVVVMGRPMATSQDFVNWVCTEAIDHNFLRYVLLSEHESMLRFASGTTHQTIYYPEAKAFHICLPSIGEQHAIAHILGTLDDKIELNRRMNETLEEIARTLFKSWFVDFSPVHAKAEGQDSGLPKPLADFFPDSFKGSELREIPEGWGICAVYDLAEYINGGAYRAFEPNEERRGLPIVKIAELKAGVTAQTRFSDVEMPRKFRIDSGDILFSWSGNPDTSIDTFVWSHGPAWLNQHIFRVVPHSANERSFVLATLRYFRPQFTEIARNKQTTGLGHVTVEDLKRLRTVRPHGSILSAWSANVDPLHARAFGLDLENQTLSTLRSTLLAKLISGELRIKDAERVAAHAL
ncbi:MAG: restriction endonuclease subunit S [Proteobacteria bacterium]|nr:restriction endonuclease subunit S [Pseudomonadota bacterium]